MHNKIIVAGSRNFYQYSTLEQTLDFYLQNLDNITIISGTAMGADTLAIKYAKNRGYNLIEEPADWNIGRHAGYLRNQKMAKMATHCVVFWNGKSKGSRHMIDIAIKHNIPLLIKKYWEWDGWIIY